jgi:hypothetical protein
MPITLPPTAVLPPEVREARGHLAEMQASLDQAGTKRLRIQQAEEQAAALDRSADADAVLRGEDLPEPTHVPAWRRGLADAVREEEAYALAVQQCESQLREVVDQARPSWAESAAKQRATLLTQTRTTLRELQASLDNLAIAWSVETFIASDWGTVLKLSSGLSTSDVEGARGTRLTVAQHLEGLGGVLDKAESRGVVVAPTLEELHMRRAGAIPSMRAVGV